MGGEENDGDVVGLADQAGGFDAVFFSDQMDIHQHQIGSQEMRL